MNRATPRASAVIALTALPLVAVCPLGPSWRYAAVSVATVLPLVVLVSRLPRRSGADRAGWALMAAGTAVLAAHNVHNQVTLAGTGRPAAGTLAAATLALGYLLLVAGDTATLVDTLATKDPA